uniref:histidine kinase n=1 Tax=Roseihalotalea indica TaxID=2867963 RepID=A0AA49GSQ7_9BACT|nr:GAF domain-containing sensor histidine kinase [Tunicatimonas sp. TK19036]
MDHIDFVNTSLRLRYEAFSKFATNINQAHSLEEIAEAIAANLKFVMDAFIFRLAITINQETYTFELFRGVCTVHPQTSLNKFEKVCLTTGLPRTLSQQNIQQEPGLQKSLFNHPKITHLMVLPISTADQQQLVLSIANKNDNLYTEIDFRFARLIEELLSTKVSQLLLLQKIASKNLALQQANQRLSQLNQEVQTLNAELEIKVEERTYRLKEAHEELNTLLYRTSHDFRRPLTSILGIAQLLTMNPSATEIETLAGHLKTTVNGLDNMLLKLQTLMLAETIEEACLIDFQKLIETIENKFKPELTKNNIHFSYQVHHTTTYTSHIAIHAAILENLVENAIRYCRTSNPFIKLEVQENSSSFIIRVADNGEGIPEHLQPVVYDMYVRASDRAQGNGLGLFVVKKMVEALGGSVSFTSEVQKGTTFSVILPQQNDFVSAPQVLTTSKKLVN